METIRDTQGSLYWYTGAAGSRQVFQQSGVFLLTNGYLTHGGYSEEGGKEENKGENRVIGRPLPAPGASTVKPDQGPGVKYQTPTRPPLAGPYAFSRLPRPVDDLPKIYLRNDLPATWLFTNASTNNEGNGLVTVGVPRYTHLCAVFSNTELTAACPTRPGWCPGLRSTSWTGWGWPRRWANLSCSSRSTY